MQFHVLIVRLSPFRDVVKSTTHQFLYGECARVLPDDCIDFAFLPTESDRRRHESLTGMRTHIPASEFDVMLISNSYAVELINLPYILKIAGIPYSSDERSVAHTKPLIIMGGSNALASQGILFSETNALVDAVYFGEGEQNVTTLIKYLSELPEQTRRTALNDLQNVITGLRVFGAPLQKTEKAIYRGTNTELLANARQALFDSPEANTVRLQISYDCPSFCTFCFEGWERKPYREVPFDELIRAAKHLKQETGASTLEITAFNFNTHTEVTRIITEMNKIFAQVNFMSQRADILASNTTLAAYETAAGKRQYTIGVEGISGRMRAYFNKNLDKPTLMKSLELLVAQGAVKEMKLFFILAGIETEDDFADFKELLTNVTDLRTQYGRNNVRVLCSFGLLVRMPFTPLRYERLLLTKEEWTPIVEQTRRTVEGAGYEFRLTYPYEEYFLSQTLVMTNQYIAPVLTELADKDIVYDQTLPGGTWEYFTSRIPVTLEFTSEKKENYSFAYASVDTHTETPFLYARFLDAKAGKETKSCMSGECHGCGSCTPEMRAFLQNHEIHMPTVSDKSDVAGILLEKQRAKPLFICVGIPETLSHSHQETRDAWLIRKLCTAVDGQVPGTGTTSVMNVKDTLSETSIYSTLTRWYGNTVYAVYPFSNDVRPLLMQQLAAAGYSVNDTETVSAQFTVILENGEPRTKLEKTAAVLLNSMHLPFVLSRNSSRTSLAISTKALKKHIVSSCTVQEGVIAVTCTIKADFTTVSRSNFIAHIDFT